MPTRPADPDAPGRLGTRTESGVALDEWEYVGRRRTRMVYLSVAGRGVGSWNPDTLSLRVFGTMRTAADAGEAVRVVLAHVKARGGRRL